jgi:hypothetical protein
VLNKDPCAVFGCFKQGDQCFDKSASKLDKLSLGFVIDLGRDNLLDRIHVAACETITCRAPFARTFAWRHTEVISGAAVRQNSEPPASRPAAVLKWNLKGKLSF